MRAVLWVVVLAMTVTGCAVDGLSFVEDERIGIEAPRDNERVDLPLQVSWSVEEYGGRVAIFFDRVPMAPGRSLASLVPDDHPCQTDDTCPHASWLADRDIYVIDGTSAEVAALPDRRNSDRSEDRHELTMVLLDESDRRVGESAFIREFIVERED